MATSPSTVTESELLPPVHAAAAATTPAIAEKMNFLSIWSRMSTSLDFGLSRRGLRRLPTQPGGVVHVSIAVDDHRIDPGQRFDEPNSAFGPHDEYALGNSFGGGRIGPDDSDAAHAGRRQPGSRVEDMVIAHAVRLEIALVVAGGGDRGVRQRKHRHHGALAPGVADADHPGPSALVAENPAVAPGHYQCFLHAAGLEQGDAVVYGVTLGDAAEIDLHVVAGEFDRAPAAVQPHVPIVDSGQRRRDFFRRGLDAFAVVEHASDARESDVERAFRQL